MSWPTVTLDSIKAKLPYACVGGPFGSNLTSKHYVDEGVPVIRGQNLGGPGCFDEKGFVFVTPAKADKLRPNLAFRGDVLFTQRGTLGQVGLIPDDSKYDRYVVSQSQMKLTVDPNRADARYVYQYFRLESTIQEILNRTITAGVPHINLGILKSFEIPLPPLPDQQAIAEFAQAYDDLIATNQRRIALLEDAARRIYREWFVHLRFPGHESVPVKGGVPAGWGIKRLSAIANVNGRTIRNEDKPDSILYIDISSVTPGLIGEVTLFAFAAAPGRARRRVSHGDVIWSCVRPNRRSYALIWNPDEKLVVSTGFAVLSASSIPFSYLYFATTTDDFVGHLEQNATGAAYPAVTAKVFEDAELLIPDFDRLELFDSLVLPMLEQIDALKKQNTQLAQARDLLLPKLMSGQLAVSGMLQPEEEMQAMTP